MDHVVLINSFFGLDDPLLMPPNIIVTGPLANLGESGAEQLRKKDEQLYEFLELALKDKKPVIYLSLGTVATWCQWQVDAFYKGLKKIDCRVVWSLRDLELPDKQDSDFYAKPWIP